LNGLEPSLPFQGSDQSKDSNGILDVGDGNFVHIQFNAPNWNQVLQSLDFAFL
jgi:hypothetical protein